jgi:hypothetical protein
MHPFELRFDPENYFAKKERSLKGKMGLTSHKKQLVKLCLLSR